MSNPFPRSFRLHEFIALLAATILTAGTAHGAALKISANSNTRAASEVEANYSATHLYVDENAGDSIPITIFFDPGILGVESAQVFTNLNRRDKATVISNGEEEGILPYNGNLISAGDDTHYFKAYAMSSATGGYQITLNAQKTGAYRLTARYRLNGDAPNTYRWYSDTDGGGKRDHALVITPVDARDLRLYEMNVFNVEASGATFNQRSTLEDLHNAPGAPHNGAGNHWDLDYLLNLGCNWLWFQPIHPDGIEGRETDPGTNQPYDPGSPYAVKNFFAVNELMTKDYNGGNPLTQNRAASMTAFQNFVAAADAKGVGVMLDAPFNHTAFDCELAPKGVELFANAAQPTNKIKDWEARLYSRDYNPAVTGQVSDPFATPPRPFIDGGENYANRATSASDIAPAPDRFDFGKWSDVKDVFFGRYDALVEYNDDRTGPEVNSYNNEGDWFDATTATGSFDSVTRNVWKYFAEYTLFWLDKTGVPAGSDMATQTAHGIDGLRADFGQGFPPQLWEYITNKTRTRKWNFVFMAESLDGGHVTYRSSRHFDILNENIVFPLKSASNTTDYRNVFEGRRTSYGQALVLLNNTSHDEENFSDPWQALVRYAVCSIVDGVPLIFPGQELGISYTYGYTNYETNFGKQIPHFKKWNSMMPIWNNRIVQLYPVYAGIGLARKDSPALRSSNRYFINQTGGGGTHPKIFSAARFQSRNAAPNFSDVVFAFVNIDRDNTQLGNFDVNQDTDGNSVNDYGIKPGRTYNVRNIAAYTAQDPNRRNYWQWNDEDANAANGSGRLGSAILANGIFVSMNKVPTSDQGWTDAPYEAQYLKLIDVTPPPAAGQPGTLKAYSIGNDVTFTWSGASDTEGGVSGYRLIVGTTPGGNNVFNGIVPGTSMTVAGSFGQTLYARVITVNNVGVEGATSTGSAGTIVLDPAGDQDADGQTNSSEDLAGTNPLNVTSYFAVSSIARSGNTVTVQAASVAGRNYTLQVRPGLASGSWTDVDGTTQAGTGGTLTFQHSVGSSSDLMFYRVRASLP